MPHGVRVEGVRERSAGSGSQRQPGYTWTVVLENVSEQTDVEILGLKRHQVHSFPTGAAGGRKEWTRGTTLGESREVGISESSVQIFFNHVAISKGKNIKLSQHLRQKFKDLGTSRLGAGLGPALRVPGSLSALGNLPLHFAQAPCFTAREAPAAQQPLQPLQAPGSL